MISEKPIDFDRFVRWLIAGGIIALVYFLLLKLSAVLLPFLLAWLTAYLLEPLVLRFQRVFKRRFIAVVTLFISVGIFSAILAIILIPLIADEFKHLYSLIDRQLNSMHWPNWLPKDVVEKGQIYLENYDFASVLSQDGLTDKLSSVLGGMWGALSSVYGMVGAIFGVVTYTLYLVFLMLDFHKLMGSWKPLIPEKHREFVERLAEDIEVQMNGYFRAQSKIVIVVSILFAIGFKIIGLPFAIVLGVLVGLLNYIPYMQLAGLIPAIGLAAIQSIETQEPMWIAVLLVLVVFSVIQLIQEAFLTPRLMGDFSGLHPALILLSLSIWGALLGMVGLIIAIPFTAIIISYYKRIILKNN